MSWTYSDWATYPASTAAEISAKLTRLRLHIAEVSNRISENYSVAGRSKTVDPLNTYLVGLQKNEQSLAAAAGEGGHTTIGLGGFGAVG